MKNQLKIAFPKPVIVKPKRLNYLDLNIDQKINVKAMKETPILFSTAMVQAILAGRKTMTRRVVKPKLAGFDISMRTDGSNKWPRNLDEEERFISYMKCPYGQVGDLLWVRETWWKSMPSGQFPELPDNGKYHYKADYNNNGVGSRPAPYWPPFDKWKPSIHMPKAACRIFLRITNIRVERLQDITEQDAISEGVEQIADYGTTGYKLYTQPDAAFSDIDAKWSFESLWQSINGKESWNANPWVWVVEFERVEK